jgi:hypothetical protein
LEITVHSTFVGKSKKIFLSFVAGRDFREVTCQHFLTFSGILLFSFYSTPIPFITIDLIVYYPLKYPLQPPSVDILSPRNEMTRKVTTSTGRYEGSVLSS